MSEAESIARTDHPRTVASLTHDLRALGVERGMTLLVHSSLSAIGWVAGGPLAVVLALEEALGRDGTLMMPTHSGEYSDPADWQDPPVPAAWWPVIREHWPAFDPASTPTRSMGAIVECFRSRPGVIRSTHPQHSFAARGPAAPTICAEHPLEDALGERSPLARAYDLGASVLLLGVGFDSCTSIHLAEERADRPGMRMKTGGAPVSVNGTRTWVSFEYADGDTDDFEALGAAFEQAGNGRRGTVGSAASVLMSQRALVDFAVPWLTRTRGAGAD